MKKIILFILLSFAAATLLFVAMHEFQDGRIGEESSAQPQSEFYSTSTNEEAQPPSTVEGTKNTEEHNFYSPIPGGSYSYDRSGKIYFSDALEMSPLPDDTRIEGFHQLMDDNGIYIAYASDGNSVYFGPKKILGANPITFKKKSISDLYDTDDANVFYSGMGYNEILVQGTDITTFIPIKTIDGSPTLYAMDKNFVYCNGIVIDHADLKTFSVQSIGSAIDINYQYDGCMIYDPLNP